MNEEKMIETRFSNSIECLQDFSKDSVLSLIEAKRLILTSLRNNGKILICGNGGSAADSQHLAAEFISRLRFDRAPLASIALGTNSSNMSAIGNDYGYDQVFKREILALGNSNDIAPFFQVSPLHKYQPSYCVLVFPEPSLFCK